MFIDLVNRGNVWVIQRRSGLGLALKAAQRLRIFRNFIRKKFQCHEAFQLRVLSLVDDAHAAATKLFNNAVMRYVLADHAREESGSAVILRTRAPERKPLLGRLRVPKAPLPNKEVMARISVRPAGPLNLRACLPQGRGRQSRRVTTSDKVVCTCSGKNQ